CITTYFPVHPVNVPRFALSKHEVTFAQWDACLDAGGCNGYRPHDRGWGRGDRAAIRIRWSDAQAYVAWLSQQTGGRYRLPSESEWEYAARADTQTKYHWGDGIGRNRANCDGCGSPWDGEKTAPVGSFAPNAWGLHDIHGNVLEWTADCDNDGYVGAPTDGSAWLAGNCGSRVVRGGAWDSDPRFVRSAYRGAAETDFIVDVIGFRVARTLSGGGGGGSSGGGGGGTDRRPEVVRELDARTLAVGAALTLDLSEAFRSRDGGGLSYAASSTDPAVADATVEGATVTVRALAVGAAEVRVTATDGAGRSISQRFAVTVTAPEAVWYLPPASDPALQGFVRVVNRSGQAGEVTVTATDDAGLEYQPLKLSMAAHAAAHFNSADLEDGNPAKGLAGSTGPGAGAWRLEFEGGGLDVEALGYLRAPDGFVTGLGATAPMGGGALELATFNPASNWRQASRLRLVNPSEEEALATVIGVDDAGRSPGEPVELTLPAGTACEVDASALESGRGLACGEPQAGLGDGTGKWRLAIESDAPLVPMGLLSSPAGQLSNLSGAAAPDADGVWHVPLFPPASDPDGRQGFVRVISRSGRDGAVTIAAFDDTEFDYEPLTLRLGAGEAAQFNSDDLELGNAAKGLSGSTGPGTGTWRLALSSDRVDFEAHAYVRHRDGFLTAMQAAAPERDGTHRIATFNPGSNWRQASMLRLVNRGLEDATATVTGADDRGVRPGGPVEVRVRAGAAVELTAAALESGESDAIASGALGDGAGKWRLRVRSEGDLAVTGLLRSPMGHLSNLSRSGGAFGALPSLLAPPSEVSLDGAGHRRVRGEWAEVTGARYGVALLLGGAPVEGRSLAATTRTDFRWSGLEPGAYSLRVRSVDAGGAAGPWSAQSNEVAVD
ncbi:MAG: SUMF1/EgtB/PvdO family nonheme iron enzyme, partial [Gammaproteobacteria bacterium]|nr:SUMF1/EgtB/PvdO family nonheme iron enzyme [Gammaproteobacteria bacterium]